MGLKGLVSSRYAGDVTDLGDYNARCRITNSYFWYHNYYYKFPCRFLLIYHTKFTRY